jgi:hypothetical protein
MKTVELTESEALTINNALSKYRKELMNYFIDETTPKKFKLLALEEMNCIDKIIDKL